MVVALSGRRIDATVASGPIFPVRHIELVRERIYKLLLDRQASAIVCSAACGADLIALEVAAALGIRKRIVLPFDSARFRETSVIDRPGDWGPIFDRVIAEAEASDDLVRLALEPDRDESYLKTCQIILRESLALAAYWKTQAAALLVWNGVSRGEGDITDQFARSARGLGLPIMEVLTI